MDKKTKYKLLGLTALVGLTSFFYIQRERNRPIRQKMAQKFIGLQRKLDSYFQGKSAEEMIKLVTNNDEFVEMIQKEAGDFFDLKKIDEEISKIDFIRQLSTINQQINQLLEIRLVVQYIQKNSLRQVQEQIIEKLASQRVTIMQYNTQFGESIFNFQKYVQCSFLQLINELEQLLQDLRSPQRIVAVNYYFMCILDYFNNIFAQYPNLKNLVAIVMLEKIGSNQLCFDFYHDCTDNYYVNTVKTCQRLKSCDCCIFDLLCRYISIFQSPVQQKFLEFIKFNQLFQTQEHLLQLGTILFKNTFYLGGQLSEESLHFIDTFSPIHSLLIEATSNKSVQEGLLQSEEFGIVIQYLEKVINNHENPFLNRLLASLIDVYSIIYPLFYNESALKQIVKDEEKIKQILSTFFGSLLNLESRDTYDSNKQKEISILDWFALNMGTIFTQQLLGNISVEFIHQLLKLKEIEREILFTYMYCLRVSQNTRIKDRQQKKKNVDINSFITKLISLIVISLLKNDFSNKNMDLIINNLGFVDDDERSNIFLNILKIQFEIPSMNLNYLKYVSSKCRQLSQETYHSFSGFYTNVLNPTTLSFDQYMISMQLGIIYGKVDSFFAQIGQGFLRDLQQFDQYKDFLQRDLILIIDLMENPYYFANVLIHNRKCPQDIYKQLLTKVAISIWQLDPKITFSQLQQQMSLFIMVEILPQFIKDLFIVNQDGTIKLKEQQQLLWPFLCLQRDCSSVEIYLNLVGDEVLFNELLQESDSFEFLTRIQETMFNSSNFIQIIYQLLLCVHRLEIKTWIGKILFYANKFKNINKECDTLLKSKECQSFILEMPDNFRTYMLFGQNVIK
ncbi:unnamed protein product [Paramecium pentaurelia]|uniref:Uncharacterized protein n=1 Tax=Paramecium pentaurelia TaxID=43138 RepID=A0A8S1UXV1_9CILI|nr:unnamed protein product [Paramecium pentaurelia]